MQGVSDARVRLIEESPSAVRRLLWGLGAAAGLVLSPVNWFRLFFPTNDPRRFEEKCYAWISVGYAAGLLGAADG